MNRWKKLKNETGKIEVKISKKSPYKLLYDDFCEFIKNNPGIYQKEIGKHFGAGQSELSIAL